MTTDLLIAEPNAELRGVCESLFSEMGIRVETAADGLECWSKLQESTPDALVLDMDMPWGGGEGVLARLREDHYDMLSPAVFITGVDSPIILSRRYGIAVRNCFQKPFRPSELLASVCAVVDADAKTALSGNPD